jgi:hypothetical protein
MKWCWAAIFASTVTLGCAGEETSGQTAPPDGGTQAEASVPDASVPGATDSSRDATEGGPGFIDIFDAFPIPDGPVGDCLTCVRDRCGMQVNQCANSAVCRAGLVCTLTTCVAGSGDAGPDLGCVTGCFMGDIGAAFSAVGALTCINMSCGAICMAGGGNDSGAGDATSPGDSGGAADSGSASDSASESGATSD